MLGPQVMLKLDVMPMRALYKEMGKESLYKRLEQALQRQVEQSERSQEELLRHYTELNAILKELLAMMESINPNHPDLGVIKRAIEGEKKAICEINRWGHWEAYLKGESVDTSRPYAAYLLDLEKGSQKIGRLFARKRFACAAKAIERHPFLSLLFWPEALARLKIMQEQDNPMPLQMAILLEVELSLVAAADVQFSHEQGPIPGVFHELLPIGENAVKNTAALFYQWFKAAVGGKSVAAIINDPKTGGITVSEVTLHRWSMGRHFPSKAQLSQLAAFHFGDEQYGPMWSRYWAAKHINFIGYLVQSMHNRVTRRINQPSEDPSTQIRHWPVLPFGHTQIDHWLANRYPVWLAFHRERKQKALAGSQR